MSVDLSLIERSACEVVDLLREQAVSPHDLLDTLAAQVARVESQVNALPTLCFERAHAHADALLKKPVSERGLLCGLPVPIKDLTDVAGVRTTRGSLVYRDRIPDTSDAGVSLLEARGGVVYAKSNTPEFGSGGHTYNGVFGITRNPWDLSRSAGGSSGGAAAALASRTAWVAQGSDLAGSLRTPSAFCGVVGLRPSPGRVSYGPSANPYDTLGIHGPMARNVTDTALLLDAMCGEVDGAPLSLREPATSFLDHARKAQRPARVAFSEGLGIATVEPEILAICRRTMDRLTSEGIGVDESDIDLSGAKQAFHALRGIAYATNYDEVLAQHRDVLNPNVIWNIEFGLQLDNQAMRTAQRTRSALFYKLNALLQRYDVLICPASIVLPFPVEMRDIRDAVGQHFETYIDWLAITYSLTLTGMPVIAIPCGMSASGLPVAIQIVGKPRGEAALLSAARAIEEIIGTWASGKPQAS
ncbi:amidase [Paraburkholderia metrosideri]|uniref:Acylamidase n=1 Tax=Paraburkholderia metrosideri TaxID=580937 RepID=A0ABM8NLA7_9BURK|nr:amidase family protein [Paraburkholderia metrosideri]CAD6531271.1 Acylamidase [Paraburkholderia metrosideri]